LHTKRLVAPTKPGKSSGGKGLPLKADTRSDDKKRKLPVSLTTPEFFFEVAVGVTKFVRWRDLLEMAGSGSIIRRGCYNLNHFSNLFTRSR
jgi:hypothetical protein